MGGFSKRLREQLDVQGVSIRELSRRLDPVSPETARSNIHGWLRGEHVPSRLSRRALARALELPPDFFEGDQLGNDPFHDLKRAINRILDERLKVVV